MLDLRDRKTQGCSLSSWRIFCSNVPTAYIRFSPSAHFRIFPSLLSHHRAALRPILQPRCPILFLSPSISSISFRSLLLLSRAFLPPLLQALHPDLHPSASHLTASHRPLPSPLGLDHRHLKFFPSNPTRPHPLPCPRQARRLPMVSTSRLPRLVSLGHRHSAGNGKPLLLHWLFRRQLALFQPTHSRRRVLVGTHLWRRVPTLSSENPNPYPLHQVIYPAHRSYALNFQPNLARIMQS